MVFRRVAAVKPAGAHHWVGDGFPMHLSYMYDEPMGKQMNPFLSVDYAWPHKFEPHPKPRGVGLHPHRGFETVTFAYQGEVSHKDSAGGGGTIGTGDVQWMTAGAGVLHEEFHSEKFTKTGGLFEMIQLWVNLPAKHKKEKPTYQDLADKDIPRVALPDDGGHVRVVAGTHEGVKGPAHTWSPMSVLDTVVSKGHAAKFVLPAGWVAGLQVRYGSVRVSGKTITKGEFASFTTDEQELEVEALENAAFLLLAGEPLNEPIVGYGPFVMNSEAEIAEAIDDFNNKRFLGQQ